MTVFTGREINTAIHWLVASEGLVLPYGVWPDQLSTGRQVAELDWNTYPWNPPGHWTGPNRSRYRRSDPNASAKPSSVEMQAALDAATLHDARASLGAALRDECQRRITDAYLAEDWRDEIQRRLAARHTADQDAERDRLRGKYVEHRTWLDDAARTIAEIEAFDPTADENWTVST